MTAKRRRFRQLPLFPPARVLELARALLAELDEGDLLCAQGEGRPGSWCTRYATREHIYADYLVCPQCARLFGHRKTRSRIDPAATNPLSKTVHDAMVLVQRHRRDDGLTERAREFTGDLRSRERERKRAERAARRAGR